MWKALTTVYFKGSHLLYPRIQLNFNKCFMEKKDEEKWLNPTNHRFQALSSNKFK